MVFAGSRPQVSQSAAPAVRKTMKVLVPIHDEEFGQAIAEHVMQHQWPENAEFRLLLVLDWMPNEKEIGATPALAEYAEQQREEAHHMLKRFAYQIKQALGTPNVEEEIREGHAAEQIIAAANGWGADQIVLGSHGRSGIKKFLMGSVSQAVVSHVACSVTVVRPKKPNG
jgi:nucleotide-binding universal stress UspA family protein